MDTIIEQVKNILPRTEQLEVYKDFFKVCIKNPDDTEPVDSTFVEFIKSDDDEELRLVNIVIDEDFKGQGIGSKVVATLVTYCKENKLSFVVEGAYQPMVCLMDKLYPNNIKSDKECPMDILVEFKSKGGCI